jgi:hypothetical protein
MWQQLGDMDTRVRNNAATVLSNLLPKLWFRLPIEKMRTGNSLSDIRDVIRRVGKKRKIDSSS